MFVQFCKQFGIISSTWGEFGRCHPLAFRKRRMTYKFKAYGAYVGYF